VDASVVLMLVFLVLVILRLSGKGGG